MPGLVAAELLPPLLLTRQEKGAVIAAQERGRGRGTRRGEERDGGRERERERGRDLQFQMPQL